MPSQAPLQHSDKGGRTAPPTQTTRTSGQSESGRSPGGSGIGQLMNLQQLAGNRAVGAIMQMKKGDTPGSGGSSAPQPTPEEIRKGKLEEARDAEAPEIARELFKDTRKNTITQAVNFLSKDSSAGELRESLKAAATKAVNESIDKQKGFSKLEKSDAKQYTSSNVDNAGVVNASLQRYADEVVPDVITSDRKDQLENAVKEVYNKTNPEPKKALDKQLAAVKAQALKQAQSEAAKIAKDSLSQVKKKMTDQIKQDAKFLDSKVEVGTLGTDELDKRQEADDTLVRAEDIKAIYQNELFEPIKKAVVNKLGVGRGAWRRSKELNEFRQKMKDSAREQSNTDIDNQLKTNSLTSNKGDLGQKYFGMMAKKEAYSMSKESVDETMVKKAEEIVNKIVPGKSTRNELKDAAKTSSYAVARIAPDNAKKIRESALAGAMSKAAELLKNKKEAAVNEARIITKGEKDSSTGPDIQQQNDLSDQVKKQVKKDDIGGKSLKQAVEADSLNSGLGKIGKIIDVSTPNIGDASSLEFELKIPVSHGAYVLFGLAGKAEREAEGLTVSSEITFGAGFTTFGLDANFRAGVFLEGQGADSQGVMNLISYGLYRQMRIIAPTAADYFWGQGGKSGMQATEEAELWASMIEEQDMKESNYVDVGLTTKLKADINAGVAKMGGALGYKKLNRFDKERVEDMNGGKSGGTTDLEKLKEKAKALTKGNNRHVMELAAQATVKLGSNDVSFSFEGSAAVEGGKLRELKLKASGSIPFQFGEEGAEWAKTTAKLVGPATGVLKNLVGAVQNKYGKKDNAGLKAGGSLLDSGTDSLFLIPSFEEIGSGFAEKLQGEETINDTVRGWLTGDSSASKISTVNKIATASSLDLSIGFAKKWDKTGTPKDWEITLDVSQKKKLEVDAEIAKLSIEKSSRLGKLSIGKDDNGKWKPGVELLGIGTS